MQNVFDTIINMSITASVVILVVILARFLLKDLPKKYSYALWSIVGFRLCCPVSFKSVISIFNINPVQQPTDIVTNSGTMNYIDAPINMITPQANSDIIGGADASVTTIVEHNFIDFLPYIWLVGLVGLLIYGFVNYFIVRSKLSIATKKERNIYQSERITTPFILGIIIPKIYIPYSIDDEYYEYIISHEKYHLKRKDNIIKLIAYSILCVHWFNPLCWLAFYLMNKDMEMSCDEWVLENNEGIKKIYSNALLSFATAKKFPSPSPLCFGEGSAKSRIKNILKYKKPALIASIITIILCIAISVIILGLIFPIFVPISIILINAGYGCFFACLPSILHDHYGEKNLSTLHGLCLSSWGCASIFAYICSSLILAYFSPAILLIVLAIVYMINLAVVYGVNKNKSVS